VAKVVASRMAALMESGLFDAEWYRKAYPDADLLGMDPAVHYLTYGHLMDRDPGPGFSTRFARIAYDIRPEDEPVTKLVWRAGQYGRPAEPDPKLVVKAAGALGIVGEHDRAISLAEKWFPPEYRHCVSILRANAAIWEDDLSGWQDHVNRYLAHYGAAPIGLRSEGSVMDRLACAPQPALSGGPRVSVIMPAWNAADTVERAAQSVLDQTWRNLELLIVDDCSTDATWSVLKQIAARDGRVRIRRNTVNVGPYVSKNLALTEAKGDWITGHDADDWAHPQRLELQMGHAIGREGEPVLAAMIRMRPDGFFSYFNKVGGFSSDGVNRTSSISCLFPASFLRERAGFWDSVRFGADSEMIARVEAIMGRAVRVMPVIGMICLDLDTSLTNDRVTGVSRSAGMSPMRLAYLKAYRQWHSSSEPDDLAIPFVDSERRFKAPDAMCVSVEDISANMTEAAASAELDNAGQ
jgi:hypothetical protein